MDHHVAVAIGSMWWYGGWIILALYMAITIAIGRRLSPGQRVRFEKGWGILILGSYVIIQFLLVYHDAYTLKNSLPLHLCSFSRLLSFILLTLRKKWAFYPLFFWGLMGGLHALLTPESTFGDGTFYLLEYFIGHAGIMVVPVYMLFVHDYKIKKYEWFRAWVLLNSLLPLIYFISVGTEGNYMFLRERPLVDNPFVIGEWPWYLIGFETIGLLHFLLFSLLFYKKMEKTQP